MENLADLDVLVAKCINKATRQLAQEAVACYRGGAHRAAIVTIWLALCYDYLEKIKELDASGHQDASDEVATYNRAHEEYMDTGKRDEGLKKLLAFEKGILGRARDKFEFINRSDYRDLCRLYEDRNRCAHPSMKSLEEPYAPTPEIARAHIRNAIVIFLSQPAVQGKAAFDRICAEMEANWVRDEEGFVRNYAQEQLRLARRSLLRSLVVMAWDSYIHSDLRKGRYRFLIREIMRATPEIVEEVLQKRFPRLLSARPNVEHVVTLLQEFPGIWELLGEKDRSVVLAMVEAMKGYDVDVCLAKAYGLPFLKPSVLSVIARLDYDEVARIYRASENSDLTDRLIDLYLESGDYRDAQTRSDYLRAYPERLTPAQAERVLRAGASLQNVKGSYRFVDVLKAIKKADILGPKFEQLVNECGLGQVLGDGEQS